MASEVKLPTFLYRKMNKKHMGKKPPPKKVKKINVPIEKAKEFDKKLQDIEKANPKANPLQLPVSSEDVSERALQKISCCDIYK